MTRVVGTVAGVMPSAEIGAVGTDRSTSLLRRWLPDVLLVVACLVPLLTWWRGQQLVWGLDGSFPIRLTEVNRYFHLGSTAYAAPDARKLSFVLPWGLLLRGWEATGLPWSAGTAQRFYEIGCLLASAFGARALVRQLLPTVSVAAATAAALFYVANAYSLTTVWTSQSYLIVHYSLLPVFTLLLLRAIVTGGMLRWSAAGVGWTLLMSPAYITTPLVVTDIGVLVAAAVWAGVARAVPWRRVVGGGLIIFVVWALCNLYWIVPLAQNYSVTYAQGIASISGTLSASLFRLNSAPFLPALRLGGYWGLTGAFDGSPYYPWVSWDTPFVNFVAYVPVFFATVALLAAGTRMSVATSKSSQRSLLLLGVGLLALVFLVTAGAGPFASLQVDLFSAIHLLAPFRSVYQRFTEYMPLVIAPLMAAGIDTAIRGARRARAARSPVAMLGAGLVWMTTALSVILVPLPFWNGALYDSSGILQSNRVSVPTSYARAAAQLPRSSSAALLTLPIGATNVVYLRWGDGASGFRGIQPLSFMAPLPVIDQAPDGSRIRTLLQRGLHQGSLCSALDKLDIGFVAFESDADSTVMRASGGYLGASLQATASVLRSAPCLVSAGGGAGITLFRYADWVPGLVSFADAPGGPSVPARYVVHAGDVVTVTRPSQPYRYLLLDEPNDGGWSLDGAGPISGRLITAFRVPAGRLVLVDNTTTEMGRLLLMAIAVVIAIGVMLGMQVVIHRRRRPQLPTDDVLVGQPENVGGQ